MPESGMILPAMPDPNAEYVDVTTDGGVVTARITESNVEEQAASIILNTVRKAMNDPGLDLRAVVLDFGEVVFINSSGLAACIELRNAAAAKDARTIVYRPRNDVSDLFRLVKIDRLYSFAHDAKELDELVSG